MNSILIRWNINKTSYISNLKQWNGGQWACWGPTAGALRLPRRWFWHTTNCHLQIVCFVMLRSLAYHWCMPETAAAPTQWSVGRLIGLGSLWMFYHLQGLFGYGFGGMSLWKHRKLDSNILIWVVFCGVLYQKLYWSRGGCSPFGLHPRVSVRGHELILLVVFLLICVFLIWNHAGCLIVYCGYQNASWCGSGLYVLGVCTKLRLGRWVGSFLLYFCHLSWMLVLCLLWASQMGCFVEGRPGIHPVGELQQGTARLLLLSIFWWGFRQVLLLYVGLVHPEVCKLRWQWYWCLVLLDMGWVLIWVEGYQVMLWILMRVGHFSSGWILQPYHCVLIWHRSKVFS